MIEKEMLTWVEAVSEILRQAGDIAKRTNTPLIVEKDGMPYAVLPAEIDAYIKQQLDQLH